MPRPASPWRHALPPAVGVVLGVVVGVLLNVVTSGGPVTAVIGLVVVAGVWAGWEGWHSMRKERVSHSAPAGEYAKGVAATVRIDASTVEGGRVVGAAGWSLPADTNVAMTFDTVKDATVVGIYGAYPPWDHVNEPSVEKD